MASNQAVIDAVHTLTDTVTDLSRDVKELRGSLTGSVDGKTPGVNARLGTVEGKVDDIVKAEAGRKRLTVTAVFAAIGAVITGIINYVTGHHG